MVLIISGPSGVGKTTITHAVRRAFADDAHDPVDRRGAVFSVSATTRAPTPLERDGVDYHFVTNEHFDRLVEQGAFLEWAGVFGRRYGTLREWVDHQIHAGRLVILEIDVQGAINVKRQIPAAAALFVLPPSEEDLLARLRARKREPEEAIQRRFAEAKREIAQAQSCGVYETFIVNDTLDRATAEAIGWVRARLHHHDHLNEPRP
jgi:guanylate kinase